MLFLRVFVAQRRDGARVVDLGVRWRRAVPGGEVRRHHGEVQHIGHEWARGLQVRHAGGVCVCVTFVSRMCVTYVF